MLPFFFLPALLLQLERPETLGSFVPDPCAAVGEVLLRFESPAPTQLPALVGEILALGAPACLFDAIGRGRVPIPGDDQGLRLGPEQYALALEAAHALAEPLVADFVEDVAREARTGERLVAAVRLAGRRPSGLALLGRAMRGEPSIQEQVLAAFESSLVELLAAEPDGLQELGALWRKLPAEAAAVALRAITRASPDRAFATLSGWLGLRAELDEALILALGDLAATATLEEREVLAARLPQHSDAARRLERAVLSTLARLEVPDAIPFLISALAQADGPNARGAQVALRAVSRVNLPANPESWATWYAREDAWWQETAPSLIERLAEPESTAMPLAELHVLLREVSAHPMRREELASSLAPALDHPDPAARVLTCQALGRLRARSSVPLLLPLLVGGRVEVVTAARAALVAITGLEWRGTTEAMVQRLEALGFVVQGTGLE